MADMDDIKNYLHIDDDQVDELRQAETLAKTAETFIERQTGKKYVEDDELMRFAVKLLVAHWYTNRTPLSKANVQEYPYSLRSVLYTIELNDAYAPVGGDGA